MLCLAEKHLGAVLVSSHLPKLLLSSPGHWLPSEQPHLAVRPHTIVPTRFYKPPPDGMSKELRVGGWEERPSGEATQKKAPSCEVKDPQCT